MRPSPASMRISGPRLAVLSLMLLVFPTLESAGQAQWQKTVKVIAPVEQGIVTRALTDSALALVEAQDRRVRRAPQSDTTVTLPTIEEALSKEGLAPTSATHVFITYRFTYSEGRLHRDILNLHFIYRPSAEQGEDIPILYLDLTKDGLYRTLLVEKGTPVHINEAAFRSFEEQIVFHSLKDTATVVQVGNRVIRDAEQAASEKKRIMKTVRRLVYE